MTHSRRSTVRLACIATSVIALVLGISTSAQATPAKPKIDFLEDTLGPATGGQTVDMFTERADDTTTVMFGSTPATSVTVLDSEDVRAVAPAHAPGVVNVRLTTSAGTSATSVDTRYRFGSTNQATVTTTSIDPTHPGQSLLAVACASVAHCVALSEKHTYVGHNRHWTVQSGVPAEGFPVHAYCESGGRCYVWGHHGLYRQVGAQWHQLPEPSGGIRYLSCIDKEPCYAVDGPGLVWTLIHGTWSKVTAPYLGHGTLAFHCDWHGQCVAADKTGALYRRASNGTWSDLAGAPPITPTVVSCWSSTECAAATASGQLVEFAHGAWKARKPAPGPIVSLTCPATSCVTANDDGDVAFYRAGHWGRELPVTGTDGNDQGEFLPYTACLSEERCEVVDGSGYALTITQRKITSVSPVSVGTGHLSDVSCSSASSCMAVDLQGNAFTYADGSWSSPHAVDADAAISCATPHFCATVGGGLSQFWRGTTWGLPRVAATGDGDLIDLDCTSARFCAAWSKDGKVTLWNGTSWSALTYVSPSQPVVDVSCWADGQCRAAGKNGWVSTLEGTTWSRGPYRLHNIDGQDVSGIDCPTADTCLAWLPSSVERVSTTSTSSVEHTVADMYLADLYCPGSSTDCLALSEDDLGYLTGVSYFDGSDWTTITGTPGFEGSTNADCAPPGTCMMVGEGPTVDEITYPAGG